MKNFKIIILISVILQSPVVFAQPVNNLLFINEAQSLNSSWAGVYKPLVKGTANLGSGGGPVRDIFFFAQKLRMRQNGTIKKAMLYCADTSGLTGVYIKIWRRNGNKFDFIGKSDNFVHQLINGGISEVTLENPVAGVREGDYYSILVENGNLNFFGTDDPDVVTYYNQEDVTGTYNWYLAPNKAWGYNIVVRMFMEEPDIVYFGNSILSGYYKNKSFLEPDTSKNEITATIPYFITKGLSDFFRYDFKTQNMSVGGQVASDFLKRIRSDVLNLKPRMVVIESGINDIIAGVPSASIVSGFSDMLDSCTDNNIKAFVLSIQPMSIVSNKDMLKRDSINSKLKWLCENKNHVYIDLGIVLGVARDTGLPSATQGNLWNLNPGYYSGDGLGIHLNTAGTLAYSNAVIVKIKKWIMTEMTGFENFGPKQFRLYQNFPNPFNPFTTIKFDVAENSRIILEVYDITGRRADIIADSYFEKGSYLYGWDGTGFSSGIYFYSLNTGSVKLTGKMILVK